MSQIKHSEPTSRVTEKLYKDSQGTEKSQRSKLIENKSQKQKKAVELVGGGEGPAQREIYQSDFWSCLNPIMLPHP